MLDWLFGRKKPEQEKKPEKKNNKDDKWMYDLLIQFLSSPQWRVNIMNFVDQNCIIFDNQQQNKFEYTKVHNDFKKLIAGLFDTTMGEIGLTQDKLIGFIQKGLESKHKKLFEQLLICDDFLKFKQIMVKRNKVLSEQVLKQLEKQGNRSSLVSSRKNIEEDDEATKRMIQKALKQSALNFKQKQKSKQEIEEQQILKQVMQMSQREQKQRLQRIQKANELAESEFKQLTKKQHQQEEKKKRLIEEQKHQREEEERKKKEQLIEERKRKIAEQRKKKKEQSIPVPVVEKNLPPVQEKSLPPVQEKSLPPVKKAIQKVPVVEPVQKEIPKASIQKPNQQENKVESIEDRKKRLLEQRELLKRKKMQQRQKQLEKPQKNNVQTILLDENGFNQPRREPTPQKEKQTQLSQDQIARRRELMRKIKNKIIDDL